MVGRKIYPNNLSKNSEISEQCKSNTLLAEILNFRPRGGSRLFEAQILLVLQDGLAYSSLLKFFFAQYRTHQSLPDLTSSLSQFDQ